MFCDHPTAADYALSNAEEAIKKNKNLEARVAELEKQVKYLMMRDVELITKTEDNG